MVDEQNIRSVDRVVAEVTHHLTQARRIRVIYVELVDRKRCKQLVKSSPQQVLRTGDLVGTSAINWTIF